MALEGELGTRMLERYLHWLSGYFYAQGYDREDMLQEARIAAWLAPAGLERLSVALVRARRKLAA